ncbi:MAG: exodeoxyribonuclease VII large subunit [bacterium]
MSSDYPYSVSEITGAIKSLLERGFPDVTVEGEISNARYAASGHLYFTLKDESASISAVMFRNRLQASGVQPKDGEQVTVNGSIGVYARRGNYQIIVERISRTGIGRILQMLEERKQKFAAEGLFAREHKKPLPLFPRKVAVVTSSTGAAIRDILHVIGRRNAGLHIVVVPCTVQGDQAAEEVAAQLARADRLGLGDVIIVGRGGGSIEDLLPFSEERVVRAIFASKTPVISAVGHETDTTLSDLVADYRAPTPSAAAEAVTARRDDLLARTMNTARTIVRSFLDRHDRARLAISRFSPEDLERSLRYILQPRFQQLDELRTLLGTSMEQRVTRAKHRLEMASNTVESASPYHILDRGYVMVRNADNGTVLTAAADAASAGRLSLRFRDGIVGARPDGEQPEAIPAQERQHHGQE